jgi:hypothetical protein
VAPSTTTRSGRTRLLLRVGRHHVAGLLREVDGDHERHAGLRVQRHHVLTEDRVLELQLVLAQPHVDGLERVSSAPGEVPAACFRGEERVRNWPTASGRSSIVPASWQLDQRAMHVLLRHRVRERAHQVGHAHETEHREPGQRLGHDLCRLGRQPVVPCRLSRQRRRR